MPFWTEMWTSFHKKSRLDRACFLNIILPALLWLNVVKVIVPVFCYNLKENASLLCKVQKYMDSMSMISIKKTFPSALEAQGTQKIFQSFTKNHKHHFKNETVSTKVREEVNIQSFSFLYSMSFYILR